TPDVLTETTADLAFTLLMSTARRVIESVDYIRNNQWTTWSPMQLAGKDIHNKTIGIFGMGRIGEAISQRAKGFGMEVIYNSRTKKEEAEKKYNAKYVAFSDLLAKSDFVVSTAPLTSNTKNIFNDLTFEKMKSSAIFINISRGGLVNEKSLANALQNQEILGAGLDVFEDEPISGNHPLLTYKNCVTLPHIGSSTVETRTKMIELACHNVRRVLQGNPSITPIN